MLSSLVLKAVGLNLLANAWLFCGITFLSRQFMPSLFSGFYESTPTYVRLAIFALYVSVPINWLIAMSYRISGPAITGAAYTGTAVLVMFVVAVLISRVSLSPILLFALVLAIASCGWVAYLLERAS